MSRAGASLLVAVAAVTPAQAGAPRFEWSGFVSTELRGFPQEPLAPIQHGNNLSVVAQPELYFEWDDGRKSLSVVPFLRLDQHDPERTHGDLREALLQWVAERWELRAGIGKVFWGVAESQHLVDIVNQTDLVENADGEDKLGQPMVNLALIGGWGTLDLFVLPGFRERTFPGRKGRLRTALPVDTQRAVFESSRKDWHVDLAARWSHAIGDWDLGVSHFYGTSRDPRLLPAADRSGNPVLVPRYDLIQQTGVDIQATKGDWSWKLEAIRRSGQGKTFVASTIGFEYTLVGVLGTRADLGLLAEHLFDSRGRGAATPFADDLLLGVRLTLNDAPSSTLLAGVLFDRKHDGHVFNLEASRRFGDAWKLYLEARVWRDIPPSDPLFGLRNDDLLQLELARFF